MPRTQQARKRHSSTSSFTKFVARLQHTFSSKNIKSSTPVIQQQIFHQYNPNPVVSLIQSKRIVFINKRYSSFQHFHHLQIRIIHVVVYHKFSMIHHVKLNI